MIYSKIRVSRRLLASLLALAMVFSLIPFASITAVAATADHPDTVTITVKDGNDNLIKNASVAYSIDSVANGAGYISDTKTTDENGVVEVMSSDDYVADDLTIEASVTAAGYEEGFVASQTIQTGDANYDVTLVSTRIDDVEISGKTLTYDGTAQNLVSVTEIPGDIVTYKVDGAAESNEAKGIDAKTYDVEVTVKRAGKDDFVKTVQTTISPASIPGIDIEGKNLAYNEEAQELVTLTGSFEATDIITWEVNTANTGSKDIPKATAVGSYSIKLTVDRGSNYNKFVKTVDAKIIEGELDLDGLEVVGLEGVYTVEEGNPVAQEAVSYTNKGNYDLKFQLDDGDGVANESAWIDTVPTVTDAGSYIVWVKAVKASYNDKDVTVTPAQSAIAPYNVYVAKADQNFDFDEYDAQISGAPAEQVPLAGALPYGKTYDFSATDTANLAGGSISYKVELEEDGIASISDAGILTVDYPGEIKVIATLSGNDNYNECVIEYKIDVSGTVSAQGQYISFANDQVNYVLGTSDTISEKKATKSSYYIRGSISYEMESVNGVEIDESTGKITVTDYDQLAAAIHAKGGSLEAIVTATKAKFGKYGVDTASYKVVMTFEATPATPYTLSKITGTNDWYKDTATVTPASGYTIAQKASATFAATTDFNNQGTDVRYVYLRNTATNGITDQIAVNIKIDTVAPTNLKIEFSELNLIQKLGQSLGFYNPNVTIKFTAEDITSGMDHFDWTYTPETGSPVTKPIDVTINGNTATAELILPADQAEQLHGKISFNATDKANNVSITKTEEYTFIVDTIAPELSIKYQGQDPYAAEVQEVNNAHYFNSDVEVELTITETNFYAEDVVVKVSKDGAAAQTIVPSWTGKVGTFTLEGDGDYIVTVNSKDKAGNVMATYTSETITVDTKAPVIDSAYDKTKQNITITVNEHNFRASDIKVVVEALDINGNVVSVNDIQAYCQNLENWSSNGDIHTLVLESTGDNKILVDAIYKLTINYDDISNNTADVEVTESSLIDHEAPSIPKIEYAKSPTDTFLEVITLGFYNPSVTVKLTSYDMGGGVDHFTWSYVKQDGASEINHPDNLADKIISKDSTKNEATDTFEYDGDKFVATFTLTANEFAQYRGSIAASATDSDKNTSEKITDNDNVVVVDTVTPEINVEYSIADRVVESAKKSYYNNDILVTFKVNEANFFAEDLSVAVTKDGNAFDFGDITWGKRDKNDVTVGTLVIPAPMDHTGDGDYKVIAKHTDKSGNESEEYTSDLFTIDTTAPVIDVEYKNTAIKNTLEDSEKNSREYYADNQVAVITVEEHNFVAEEVNFDIIAKDVTGVVLDAESLSLKTDWSVDSTGDVHTITITYPGDANYSFDVDYTDLATNVAADYTPDYFTVDKTDAVITKIDYSTAVLDTILENITFGFYNAKMTVTITAEDETSGVHSFDYRYLKASGVSNVNAGIDMQEITTENIEYSDDNKTAVAKFEIPKLVLKNDNQFNGTVEVTATDRSGNKTDVVKETKRVVVDNIAPKAKVSFNEAANVVGDVAYYNGEISATVTINEANFYANDVKVMVSKNGGAATAVKPKWIDKSVDVHVGTFTLTEDADYVITVNYTDKSNNKMSTYTSNQLTIDTKIEAPTYSINGVPKNEHGGAYKNDAKISFNFEDQNYDTKTIKLTRTVLGSVEDVTGDFIKVNETDKGGSGTFTIPSKVENDGIYTLTIGMTDRAKHKTESHMMFTINRFGSVYMYDDYLVSLIKDGGQFITVKNGEKTAITEDLVITEYNADRLLEGSLKLLITRDGEAIDVDYTTTPANINDQVGTGNSGWYEYVYKIKASNFAEDGVYKISLASTYATNDSDKNESASVPENSIDEKGERIVDTLNFTVDTTVPEIKNIVNLDDKVPDSDKIVDGNLNVEYTIIDVGGLKSVEIIINGTTVDKITDFEDSLYSYSGSFKIKEESSRQTVQIKVTDLAGNVTDTQSEDFQESHSKNNEDSTYVFFNEITVSRNIFVRWFANPILFWGSIVGVAVIAGGIWIIIAKKRKKK